MQLYNLTVSVTLAKEVIFLLAVPTSLQFSLDFLFCIQFHVECVLNITVVHLRIHTTVWLESKIHSGSDDTCKKLTIWDNHAALAKFCVFQNADFVQFLTCI